MMTLRGYEKKLWPVVENRYEEQLEGWQRKYHTTLKALRPVTYPLKRVVEAWDATSQYGSTVEEQAGIPRWRQFADQLLLSARYGLPPLSYYRLRLFSEKCREEARFYVHHKQMDVLLEGIDIISKAKSDRSLLQDKLAFYSHCSQHEIPTPPVLLAFQEGSVHPCALFPEELLPKQNLFSKPVDGGQGRGARRWTYLETERKYSDGEGTLLTDPELKTRLKQASENRRILLQPDVQNHPMLERVVGETLCVARTVTGRRPGGQAQHLLSSLRISDTGGVTCNFSTGGIAVPIDPNTGRLGRGCYGTKIREGEVVRHPATGEEIVGVQIPYWQEAVTLTERAHDTLSRIAFVGWDVAFTERGPLILEANSGFGAGVLQIPHRKPLGRTEFAEYYSSCFEHYIDDYSPNGS